MNRQKQQLLESKAVFLRELGHILTGDEIKIALGSRLMPSPTQLARECFEQATQPSSLACPEMARIQSVLKAWEKANFGEPPLENLGLGVAEEAGELCHALLKRAQGIRGMQDETAFLEAAGDAIADCTIYLMQLASALRVDFFTLVANTASDVTKRSWKTNPTDGNTK